MYHKTQSTAKQKTVPVSPNSKGYNLGDAEPHWNLWCHKWTNKIQSRSRKGAKGQGIFTSPVITPVVYLLLESRYNWLLEFSSDWNCDWPQCNFTFLWTQVSKCKWVQEEISVWTTNSCILTKSWEPLGLAAMLQMGPPKASTAYLMVNACKSYSIISPLSPALNSRCPFAQHWASVARDSWPGKNYRNTITSQPTKNSPATSTEWSQANGEN